MSVRQTIAISFLVVFSAAVLAQQPIDEDVSGSWYAPEQSGHGLQLEMLDLGEVVVTWYAYDDQGQPMWLLGVGQARGDTIEAELMRYQGAMFPPDFDPADVSSQVWGDIRFQQTACNQAELEFEPVESGFSSGSLSLERLTRIDGSHCHSDMQFDASRGWSLHQSLQDFEALFLDYPEGEEDFYELDWQHSSLPEPWEQRGGIRISGNNHSDDLMMILMRPIDGLEPDTEYQLALSMQFATQVPNGCIGVGGPPGESVFVKLGASGTRPEAVLEDTGVGNPMRRPNIDLGIQGNSGERALLVSDMSNGLDDSWCAESNPPWQLKRVSTDGETFTARSDDTGRLWVYGLSDSGFEATTTWYLTEFRVRLRQL